MHRLIFVVRAGIIVLCSLFISGCLEEEPVEFKVMAWNIWHGGHDESLPEDGRPSVVEIIENSEADVVLMIETYGSAPYIADSLGFYYHLISNNLCIYSRYPIIENYSYPEAISTFNFGGVKILIEGRYPVIFYDTWLHYLPDTRLVPLTASHDSIIAWENAGSRDNEIEAILSSITAHIAESDSVPLIMGGDFNSHSHLDWIESTKNDMNHGGAVVDWTISRRMSDAGFIDTFREIYPDPLKNPGTTWLAGRDHMGDKEYGREDRIDYIYFLGSMIEVIDSESEGVPDGDTLFYKGSSCMYPSDHGFVVSEFRIKH